MSECNSFLSVELLAQFMTRFALALNSPAGSNSRASHAQLVYKLYARHSNDKKLLHSDISIIMSFYEARSYVKFHNKEQVLYCFNFSNY